MNMPPYLPGDALFKKAVGAFIESFVERKDYLLPKFTGLFYCQACLEALSPDKYLHLHWGLKDEGGES